MYREDYLLRLIQQLVQILARIAGLNRNGKHDEALAASEDATGSAPEAVEPVRRR